MGISSQESLPLQLKGSNAWFDRFSAIPGLFITSLVSYTLLGLQLSGFRGSEGFLLWTKSNRPLITVGVQILSHVLGLVHVQVLCTLIRTSFMLSIASQPFPIYMAQFIQAASAPRMSWVLPWRLCVPLLLIVVASFVPAAMWAGAISPLQAERNTTQTMTIPTFEIVNSSMLWDGNSSTALSGAQQWMTDKGLFSFDPASIKGAILQSAADASVGTQDGNKHAKLDKTGYSYLNRSYGIGSSAGFNNFSDIKSPNWYSYIESGFDADVSCFYNDTILNEYGFQLREYSWGLLAQTVGHLATGRQANYVNLYGYTVGDIFAWGPDYNNISKVLAVQLITMANETNDPWAFAKFKGIQCNIEYRPENFEVYVNATGKLLSSTPLNQTNQEWPSYADDVVGMVSHWVSDFSFNDACVGGCQVGRALVVNVNRFQNMTNDYSNNTVLQGTRDYLAAIVDSITANLILTRMISDAPNSTTEVLATIGVPAVVFGDFKFIIIVVVINTLIAIAYAVECIRTSAWAGIPSLDLSNICDVLICASKGGMNWAQSAESSFEQGGSWKNSTWAYSDTQPFTNKMRMHLRYGESAADLPSLIPLLDESDGVPRLVGDDHTFTKNNGAENDNQEWKGFYERERPMASRPFIR